MRIVSYTKRTEKEIKEIVKAYENKTDLNEICKKYSLSQTSFYRMLAKHRGYDNEANYKAKRTTEHQKLKKKIKQQEEEIKILRAALKKY